jgi:hypothetical protein
VIGKIVATMNRLRLRTGVGNSWNEMRVRSARSYYQLPAFSQDEEAKELTVKVAAQRLNVSEWLGATLPRDHKHAKCCPLADGHSQITWRPL